MHPLKIVKVVFLVIGLSLLGGAYYWYHHTDGFLQRAATTTGTVTGFNHHNSGGVTVYRPIFQFIAPNGEEIVIRSNSGSNPPGYEKGERVTIYFDPANPEDAKADSLFSLWGGPMILGGIGSLFFIIGLAFSLIPLGPGKPPGQPQTLQSGRTVTVERRKR